MQHATSKLLYGYWDRLRGGRPAPLRSEIDPSAISYLLPDVFIAECETVRASHVRLAGTRICQAFGRELRGEDLLGLWRGADRASFASLLANVVQEAAVAHVLFEAYSEAGRSARFELVMMPLFQTGSVINRILGAVCAIEPPAWLGSAPLRRQELRAVQLLEAGGAAVPEEVLATLASQRRFRIYQGGADASQRRLLQA